MRKYIYFGKRPYSIGVEIYKYPCIQLGLEFGEDIRFFFGAFIQFSFHVDIWPINKWLYEHKLHNRQFEIDLGFTNGLTVSVSLFADTMGWKKGDLKWYWNITDKLKGRYEVSKKIIEEQDLLIPMPEKSYQAHAILADWTWKYPRWFSKTIRRCEIDIPEGLPHAGKGENSWDCGDDATFGITTGSVRSIPEAVGQLVGSSLATRVRYGGWNDYNFQRKPNYS